jgi:predicted transposase YdaD
MRTDELFYEYFQVAPQALFELLQMTQPCPYRFESVVIKAGERRLDGLLEPDVPGHPHYFVEFQGYHDSRIYWRGIHQIGWYHEQRPHLNGSQWQLIILFLDEAYDPGVETLGPLAQGELSWLHRYVLPELLRRVQQPSPVLNVLRPLLAVNEAEVVQQAANWSQAIRQLPKDQATQERLLILLAQFMVQKFSHLSHKEITKMLKLTPIEETVAGQEWLQEGHIEILVELIEEKFGEPGAALISRLTRLTNKDLKALGRYLLKAESYKEVEAWIEGRLAEAG